MEPTNTHGNPTIDMRDIHKISTVNFWSNYPSQIKNLNDWASNENTFEYLFIDHLLILSPIWSILVGSQNIIIVPILLNVVKLLYSFIFLAEYDV